MKVVVILQLIPVPVRGTDTCAHDRRALQQLALNVHVKHPDLTWPDLQLITFRFKKTSSNFTVDGICLDCVLVESKIIILVYRFFVCLILGGGVWGDLFLLLCFGFVLGFCGCFVGFWVVFGLLFFLCSFYVSLCCCLFVFGFRGVIDFCEDLV